MNPRPPTRQTGALPTKLITMDAMEIHTLITMDALKNNL